MTWFNFSRPSRLFEVFPQSVAGVQLVPRTISDETFLVHPAIGKGAARWSDFSIAGAAGVTPVLGSVVPDYLVSYYLSFGAVHTDAVARHVILAIRGPNGYYHVLRRSEVDTPVAAIANGVVYSTQRPFFIPAGFQPAVFAIGLAAGAVLTMQGMASNVSVDDREPPLF